MNFDSMSLVQAKVMGPEEDLSPSNILVPPRLRPDTDKLLWREAVLKLAETLQACANGADSRAKGAAATLGMPLYRSLEFSKKELVKRAVRTGDLVLTPPVEDKSVNQIDMVKKIVNFVAKDSTVDRLRRIVRLYKEVTCCTRKSGESISAYIERFSGSALSYLNLMKSDQHSGDSQNFAIILLLNASLSSQTFTNIITNLVMSVKNKKCEDTSVIYLCMTQVKKVKEVMIASKQGALIENMATMCDDSIFAIEAAIQQHEKFNNCEEVHSWIGLQDAIFALEEAGLEEKDLEEIQPDNPAPAQSTKSYLNSNKSTKKNKKRRRDFDNNKNYTGQNHLRYNQDANKKEQAEAKEDQDPKKKFFTPNKRGRTDKSQNDKKKGVFQ